MDMKKNQENSIDIAFLVMLIIFTIFCGLVVVSQILVKDWLHVFYSSLLTSFFVGLSILLRKSLKD